MSTADPGVERARSVLRAHRDRLLVQHAATGVGVGTDEGKRPAIVVYLPSGQPLPAATALEGVPLIFRTIGRLKPM